MEEYFNLMQSHSSRDKVVRTVGYVFTLLSAGLEKNNLSTVSQQLNNARMVLRLFDDFSLMKTTLKWAKDEQDYPSRLMTIFSNLSTQLFLPLEHIAWASSQKILPYNAVPFWNASIWCWIVSLSFNIAKNGRKLYIFKEQKISLQAVHQTKLLETKNEVPSQSEKNLKDCLYEEKLEQINLLKNVADLMVALSSLPLSFMMSSNKTTGNNTVGTFKIVRNAILGLTSSIASLYIVYNINKKASKSLANKQI